MRSISSNSSSLTFRTGRYVSAKPSNHAIDIRRVIGGSVGGNATDVAMRPSWSSIKSASRSIDVTVL